MIKRWNKAIAVLAMSVGLSACQQTASFAPPPGTPLDHLASASVQILPIRNWQDSALDLEAGQKYRITAVGKWTFGPLCGITGADGIGNSSLCDAPDRPVPDYSGAALVGMISRGGKPFFVGDTLILTPFNSGRLYLGANQWDWLSGDKSGAIKVTITHLGPAEESSGKGAK